MFPDKPSLSNNQLTAGPASTPEKVRKISSAVKCKMKLNPMSTPEKSEMIRDEIRMKSRRMRDDNRYEMMQSNRDMRDMKSEMKPFRPFPLRSSGSVNKEKDTDMTGLSCSVAMDSI